MVVRNEIRVVAKRYKQAQRIGYDETYSPIATFEAIIILLCMNETLHLYHSWHKVI